MAGKNSRTATTAGRSSSARSKVRSSVAKSKCSGRRKKTSRSASKPSKSKTRACKNPNSRERPLFSPSKLSRHNVTPCTRSRRLSLKGRIVRLEFDTYIAPEPTPEQIQNGIDKGYDAWDLLGQSRIWACRPDDCFAAAGVVHDELTLRGGIQNQALIVASNFRRDCYILAKACESDLRRTLEMAKAYAFADIVDATICIYWRDTDLNTDVTRQQSELVLFEAMKHICKAAEKIGAPNPYPQVLLSELNRG